MIGNIRRLTLSAIVVLLAGCIACALGLCVPKALAASSPLQAQDETQLAQGAMTVKGAGYRAVAYPATSVTVSGATVYAVSYRNADGRTTYRITLSKNGSYKTVADDASGRILTNGRYLFFSKYRGRSSYKKGGYAYSSNKFTLYRRDLKSGKQKKLATVTGDDLIPYDCRGSYVYFGAQKSLYGADLYSVKISTKKKRRMATGIKGAKCVKDRVIAWSHHNVGINVPVYSFKKGGKGKKQIAKAMEVKVIGKKVYYICIGEGNPIFRKYCCTLTGKKKKAVSGWTTDYSSIAF